MRRSKYTLFLSWQSDVNSARSAIESAIQGAISNLLDTKSLNIELDQSTWNVPGMPKIEDVIKDKIERCDVFVADITPVTRIGTKLIPNPNVLIELGYALKAIGPERIILVAQNKNGWEVKDLPFDINHHRIVIFQKPSQCDLRRAIFEIIQMPRCFRAIKRLYHEMFPISIKFHIHKNRQVKSPEEKICPNLFEDSDIFFSQRLAYAFPGVRNVKWFTKTKDIKFHLSRLLHTPLKFITNEGRSQFTPIWWFRSGSSVAINNFRHISGRLFLVENEEWLISKIAVFQDSSVYYKEYLYVEIEAQNPTSLGQVSTDNLQLGATEEYGILNWKHLFNIKMTRHEYDDGEGCKRWGTIFNGQTQLRIRYLTKYNFLICANGSSYNCNEFDLMSRYYMDGLLDGTISFEEFHESLMKFQKPLYRSR
ncbi:MAG: hypothetical protein KHX48_06485 [Alistipes sp.]|nr:hypothetical protein [Alistipes sp.]